MRSNIIETEHLSAPTANKNKKIFTNFGEERIDEYFWLRNRDNPEVMEYLISENEYTNKMMKHTEKLQQELFGELKARIQESDISVPLEIDNYLYYYRTERGKQYPVYCRKLSNIDNPDEEIIFDQNEFSENHSFFQLGNIDVSPNHKILAFSADTTGDEAFTIYLKDLAEDKILDIIPFTSPDFEWANDSNNIIYSILDETKRPYKVLLHKLNNNDDVILLEEKDKSFLLHFYKTKSKCFIIVSRENISTTEAYFLNADNPLSELILIQPAVKNIQYTIGHNGGKFYQLTNEDAYNYKIVETEIDHPERKIEIVPERSDVYIENMEVFKNFLVLYERQNGQQKIRIQDLRNNEVHYIEFEEDVYAIRLEDNPDFNSEVLRFIYSSPLTPRTTIDYHMGDRIKSFLKQDKIFGGFRKENYIVENAFALAEDGVSIPISILYRKELKKDGMNPLYLYGYGAYGINSDPVFSPKVFSLVDRGFVYVIAHIRGGSELGRKWYEDGKLLRKKNTFNDFISCAEFLITEKYTSPDKLIIAGGSAGGMLIATVINMRPDLFKVGIAAVPFVDVLNTMLDDSLPLTILEHDEWGDPNKKEFYDYIKSYSPYDNLERKNYPDLLVTAGLNDTRVSYWEPVKWVAKLREMKTNESLILLKINMDAGHGGKSGRYNYLKEIAFEYAFIFDRLGMNS